MGKKVVIIGVSSIFLVALVVAAVVVGVTRQPSSASTSSGADATKSGDISDTAKAVQTICQPTEYKEVCEKSLASANTTDPKELMKLAIKAAMHEVSLALTNSTELEKANTDPMTGQSLSTCTRTLDTAIDGLRQSFDTIDASDLSKVDDFINDVQNWLTASYSCSVMCIDAFQWNTTESDKVKAEMEKALKSAKELTSNALVMVNQLEKVSDSLENPISESSTSRRLLSDDGFPNWMNTGMRRLLKAPAENIKADVVVAKDGSGQYTKVSDAVKNIPVRPDNRTYIIYVKAGVYEEYVTIKKNQTHLLMIGDGPEKTKITGKLFKTETLDTFYTGTFKTYGYRFFARDMAFENTAGVVKEQAVALHVEGDKSIFYNCRIDAFQDTLLAALNRQFYRDCTISGTVDFIFGYSSAVFQNCKLLIHKPRPGQKCIVTADGREKKEQVSGIVIHNSTITAAPGLAPTDKFESYLGRPWKPKARTIVMNSQIDKLIDRKGWMEWEGESHHETCYYREYGNRGLGADTSGRVTWSRRFKREQALKYTVDRFIRGSNWIPSWVPFVAGLE